MGFMDLSTSVSSKKHVDFNDARYQLASKLQQSGKKTVRSTFTLYDDKELNKIAVQEISAAYALSDKRLPIGELINKMVDLIVDMEDGILDTEKDAIYAWKYSTALMSMYEDKCKRQETLSIFDNGLKTSIINSQIFTKRYPGKYTNRTNFFDNKVKEGLIADVLATFKDVALPDIHEVAIRQSRQIAEEHNNPILDKIVQWAVDNYGCEADSFFEVKEDEKTNLFFSVNTIILHLRNGYDMSIIGHVGTDHDDKFAISIFDANKISIENHGERISQSELQTALTEASANDPIDPLTKLLKMEKDKNEVLKQQYEILAAIRPMVPEKALALQAAESVVGPDYIWGCKQFRATHEELPVDFKLEDVKLPELDCAPTSVQQQKQQELVADLETIVDSVIPTPELKQEQIDDTSCPKIENLEDSAVKEAEQQIEESPVEQAVGLPESRPAEPTAPIEEERPSQQEEHMDHLFASTTTEELLKDAVPQDLFADEQPKKEKREFGDPVRSEFQMPTLDVNANKTQLTFSGDNNEKEFDASATLLPGFTPVKAPKKEDVGPSITKQAQPVPEFVEPVSLWKDEPKTEDIKTEEKLPTPATVQQPDLLLDDLDSLFA